MVKFPRPLFEPESILSDRPRSVEYPAEHLYELTLKEKDVITPQDVLKLNTITNDYLVPYDANVYQIQFTRFKLREYETNFTMFELINDIQDEPLIPEPDELRDPREGRFVRYVFTPSFFNSKYLGANIEFKIGPKLINKFQMIEVHYFKKQRLTLFQFDFGFCMPNSTNSIEHVYEIPYLTQELIDDMIDHPFQTKSDSFYFVDDKLVLHQKAEYSFAGVDDDDDIS